MGEEQASEIGRGNLAVALDLAARGIAVFPVQSGGPKAKAPMPSFRWRHRSSTNERDIRDWWRRWPDAAPAIDLARAGLLVIDADRHDPEHDGVAAWEALLAVHGGCPVGPRVTTPNRGCHILFRQDGSFGNGRGSLPRGVDVRGAGGYIVAPGAVLADGRRYECSGDPAAAPDMPAWLAGLLRAGKPPTSQPQQANVTPHPPVSPPSDVSAPEIAELLSHVPPDAGYDEWLSALMAVHAQTGGSEEGLALADEWSGRGTKYKAGEVARKWRSFRSGGINGPTLAALARRHGADLSAIRRKHMPDLDHGPGTAAHGARQARQIRASLDGTLHDAETGELIEPAPGPGRGTAIGYPAGLAGAIARWIVATSWKPQPALAIAAALTIVGAAAGRQYMGPTGAGTALYVLGLAPTGQGKDMPLKQVRRIFNAARLSMHLGPDEFMSFSSVVNVMKRRPLCLCPMDEFGDFMRRIYDRKGSVHARAIPKVLRSLWGANFDEVSTAEWAEKESVAMQAPHLSIFGASTHEQFYQALEGGVIADGTLNRFLVIEGARRPPKVKPEADPHSVPADIVDGLQRVFLRRGDMAAARRNDPAMNPAEHNAIVRVGWAADGAEGEFDDFAAEVEERMIAEPHNVAFLARAVEMALRIATIVAAGRQQDVVALDDLRYGITLVQQSVDMMIAGAADYMAENEQEANWQKVVRLIRDAGGKMVYRDIQQRMRSLRSRDLRDLLAGMCDAEVLGREETPNRAGKGHPVVIYHLLQ